MWKSLIMTSCIADNVTNAKQQIISKYHATYTNVTLVVGTQTLWLKYSLGNLRDAYRPRYVDPSFTVVKSIYCDYKVNSVIT